MGGKLRTTAALAVAWLSLAGACLTPYIPTFIAVMAGPSETHNVIRTGLPASSSLLQWTGWRPVDGSVRPYDNTLDRTSLENCRIMAYRIGNARGTLSQLTFYQARYTTAEGLELIAPASGPLPLISSWYPGVIGITLLQLAVSAISFWYSVRLRPPVGAVLA